VDDAGAGIGIALGAMAIFALGDGCLLAHPNALAKAVFKGLKGSALGGAFIGLVVFSAGGFPPIQSRQNPSELRCFSHRTRSHPKHMGLGWPSADFMNAMYMQSLHLVSRAARDDGETNGFDFGEGEIRLALPVAASPLVAADGAGVLALGVGGLDDPAWLKGIPGVPACWGGRTGGSGEGVRLLRGGPSSADTKQTGFVSRGNIAISFLAGSAASSVVGTGGRIACHESPIAGGSKERGCKDGLHSAFG
jgi:hypothetical protein